MKNAIAIGNFDGVHLGHRALIRSNGEGTDLRRMVLTFTPHPRMVMKDPDFRMIYSEEKKIRLLKETGLIDELVLLPFDEAQMNQSAEDFFYHILLEKYQAGMICVGDNFRFGRKAMADVSDLKKLCEKNGVICRILPRVTRNRVPVSSSRIRRLLEEGTISKAHELLGRSYTIDGFVHTGKHVGTTMHTPTINLPLEEGTVDPRHGVYISEIELDGRKYDGISNVGINPTFGGESPRIETFIFDFDEMIYGAEVKVKPLHFIREERKFKDPQELRAQIALDIEEAKRIFSLKKGI
ncbi:MAG: bifunctional riboflavin kinase/FAD synthetase [Firmicutes bacterium]|nr:bifunctional riboflavin kinase/FAD synthetase [Bacillota bacterium]